MFTLLFWAAATERALKTGAQSALLVLGADQINALSADWVDVAGFALGGLVLSLLTSLASGVVGHDGPSLATEYVDEPGRHEALPNGKDR